MMSHAVLVVAALSVATAQTAQYTTTYGTYDPYTTQSSYPTYPTSSYYSSSSPSSYPVSAYNGYAGSSYLPYSFPIASDYYNTYNEADFDIPALFVAPVCTVKEQLEVFTLSAGDVGRELTYERDLNCDCDTNGNPIADSCVRPDDGYLAGSCYEMIACDVELDWQVEKVRFTGVDSANPTYDFIIQKSLGCYCDVLGNPQFEQCVDLAEKQLYDDTIAAALAEWEAEMDAEFLLWELEQDVLFEEWKAEQELIEAEWELQLAAWEQEQEDALAAWELENPDGIPAPEEDVVTYDLTQEYVDNYWAFIATLGLDQDVYDSLVVPPMPEYDPYAYSATPTTNPYTAYNPYQPTYYGR